MFGPTIFRKLPAALIFALVFLLPAGRQAQAATFTWSGGSGSGNLWSDANNWSSGAPANNGTAAVQFAGSSRLTPNMDANWNILSLAFNSGAGAFTLGSTGGFTLTIQGGGITNNSTNTQTINNAIALGAAQTWSATSGALVIGGNVNNGGSTLTLAGGNAMTVSGVISGTGGLTLSTTGTLTLSGVNTYSGDTTVSAGTTFAWSATAIPTGAGKGNLIVDGTVTFGNTSISLNGLSGSGTIGNNAGGTGNILTLGNNNASGNFSGVIYHTAGGALGLTKTGTGTQTLSGNNTYNGATTISAGVLNIQNANALGTTANGTTVASGAALQVQGSIAVGAEALTISGNGIASDGALRNISGTNSMSGAVTLGADTMIGSDAGVLTLGGTISDGGAKYLVTKVGAGEIVLMGNNSFEGFALNAGRVGIGSATALGGNKKISVYGGDLYNASGAPLTISSQGLDIYADFTISGSQDLTFSAAAALKASSTINVTNSGLTTISGVLSGTGFALGKTGSGTLVLSGANTYTGLTTVSAGTLRYGASNVIATGGVTVDGATAVLDLGANQTDTVGTVTVANGGSITGTGTSALTSTGTFEMQSGSVSTILAGAGIALNKTTAGTVTLSGTNTYTGVTTITGGTLSVGTIGNGGVAGGIGSASNAATNLVLNGGGLQYTGGAASTDRLFSLGTSGGTLDSSGTGTITFSNTGSMGFTGSGARTLTLTGASDGVLNAVIGDSGGATSVSITGPGTWTLGNAANTYTGVTYVYPGTLVVPILANGGVNSSIGASTNAAGNLVFLGGTLRYTGGAVSTDRLFSIGTAGGALDSSGSGTLTFTNTGSVGFYSQSGARTFTLTGSNNGSLAAVLGDNGGATALAKTGSGTWAISGVNTYTGTTTVSTGTLQTTGTGAFNGTVGLLIQTGGVAQNTSGSTFGAGFYSGSSRTATVTGSGSQWTHTNSLYVGDAGTGNQLVISAGGSVTSAVDAGLGNSAGGNSNSVTITGAGSIWNNTGSFYNGITGNNNSLSILSGGRLSTTGSGHIGFYAAATGNTATVDGTSSLWSITNDLFVGNAGGSSQLTISNAGQVTNRDGWIGAGAASASNIVTVTGASSLWANSRDLLLGSSGTNNQLNITSGGTVTVAGTMYVGKNAGSGNVLTVTNGTLNVTNGGTGVMDVRRGSVVFNSGTINADSLLVNTGGTGTFTFNGGTLTTSATTVANGSAFVVGNGTSSGVFNIAGSGAHSFANGLTVAANSRAVLTNGNVSATGGVTVNSGGAVELQNNITVTPTLTLNGSGISGGGALRNVSGNNTWSGATTLGSAGTIASDSGTLTHSGTLNNGGFTATYTGAGNVTATGVISGTGGVTKTGAGTLTMSGTSPNTFTGNTTVSGGTLAANADGALAATTKVTINTGGTVLLGNTAGNNRISNTAEVALAGGTFNTGGFTENVGKMTLSANSTFDFGSGTSRVTFDGLSSFGSSTLTVLNWTGVQWNSGGTDQLLFKNSSFTAGSTTSQVQFNIGGTLYNSIFLDVGSSTMELVPVPEPATIFGASALVLALGWRERKRLALLLRELRGASGMGHAERTRESA